MLTQIAMLGQLNFKGGPTAEAAMLLSNYGMFSTTKTLMCANVVNGDNGANDANGANDC